MVSPDMRKRSASRSPGSPQPFAIRGPPADWLGFLDLHSKGDMPRWTCVILEVWIAWAASTGWAHASYLPPPESDDAFDLALCTFAMADARSAVRQKEVAGSR